MGQIFKVLAADQTTSLISWRLQKRKKNKNISTELTSPCQPHEDTMRDLWPRKGPSPDHDSTLILDFQAPELWAINFCCLLASWFMVFLLQQPEWTKLLLKKSLFSFCGGDGRGMMFLGPEESKWPVQYCSPLNHCMKLIVNRLPSIALC